MNKALDFHVRQFIFTLGVTFTKAPDFRVYSAMQSVPVEDAKKWLDDNLHLFEVTPNTNPVPDGLPPFAHAFFERFAKIRLPRSYYCADVEFVTNPSIAVIGPSRKLIQVGDSINHGFALRGKKGERVCAASDDFVLCDEFNAVPTIWHLPLLFASMKAKRLLVDKTKESCP